MPFEYIGTYAHGEGKVGVLVQLRFRDSITARTELFGSLAHDLSMHVAALDPQFLARGDINPEAWSAELALISSKLERLAPEERLGRMNEARTRFEREVCLLEQPYVKDPSKSVKQHLAEISEALRETIEVVRFIRYEARQA